MFNSLLFLSYSRSEKHLTDQMAIGWDRTKTVIALYIRKDLQLNFFLSKLKGKLDGYIVAQRAVCRKTNPLLSPPYKVTKWRTYEDNISNHKNIHAKQPNVAFSSTLIVKFSPIFQLSVLEEIAVMGTMQSHLQALWQQKEYRNFPVEVLRYMQRDKNISGESYMLWQRLFMDSFFCDGWSIVISKKSLAKEFDTSLSTIKRRIRELEIAGYLLVDSQSDIGQPAKLAIALPKELIAILENTNDRKKLTKKCGTIDAQAGVKIAPPPRSNMSPSLYNNINNKYINNNSKIDIGANVQESVVNDLQVKLKHTSMGQEGWVDIQPINLFVEDNIAKESDSSIASKKASLEAQIEQLGAKELRLHHNINQTICRDNKLKLFSQVQELHAKKTTLENQLQVLKIPRKSSMLLQKGDRKLHAKQLQDLQTAILKNQYGLTKSKLIAKSVAREIIDGDLAKVSYKTGRQISVEWAVNIALNKIRNDNWQIK